MTPTPRIRAYVPLTQRQLLDSWPAIRTALAFAPDAAGRELHGDELEEAEWLAFVTAAEVITQDAADALCARAVLACDLPGDLRGRPVAQGIEALGPFELDPADVVSAHIDEPEVVRELADSEDAAEHLRQAALLWYDRSEISDLVEALREQ